MKRMFLIACFLCLAGSLLWAAEPPLLINYQGVLRDAAGKPLSGTYDMAFSFYDAATSGNLLLTDTHVASGSGAVTVTGGLFNAALGSGALSPPTTPFLSVFANHTNVWLEVHIGGETLSPRVQVVSAAYAQSAHSLDGREALSFAEASHAHDTADLTSGTLGAGRGGTGLSGPGTSGNVLMSNGTNWLSYALPTADMLGAVVDASDTTLSRTGGGYSGNPYKLKLNLGNANTWSGAQTFNATTNFPGSGIWNASGQVGIGTNAPDSPLQLSYAQSDHNPDMHNRGASINAVASPVLNYVDPDHFFGLDCTVSGASGVDAGYNRYVYGIRSSATAPANWDEARIFGVEANATSPGGWATGLNATASGGYYNAAVEAYASGGSATGATYGVVAIVDGTASIWNCGLQARASGASQNWAGRFLDGDVHIDNKLSIGGTGNSPPSFPLDIQATQAVARLTSTGNTFGSVLVLDNSTTSPTYFGAINFNGGAGQIAFTGTGDLAFKTASTEHMRLTAGGWLGIGLTPSYQLQLLYDSAAKPYGGSWTNPSDRRLKKNIAPFTDGLAVIEHIKPVRYQLNGLAGMPADAQGIGVIAQEIKDVAPYTVGTFKAKLHERDEAATELYDFNASALTFVLINAVKELDERTKGLVKDTESKDSTDKKSASSADEGASYAESGLLVKTTERSAQAKPSDVFQDELGNVYGRSFRPSLAEVATLMPASDAIEAGDLLVADDLFPGQVRLAAVPADPRILGVATGEPGVCLNGRSPSESGFTEPAAVPRVPVALSGIILCKADASAGPIAVGDLLTTSATPGHAMRAANPAPGTVVGKALEPLASGTGLIRVLVMLR